VEDKIAVREPATPMVFSADQIELIKSQIAKGVSNDELRLFISVAQHSGLDPFGPDPEIYAIVRKTRQKDNSWKESMVIQVSVNGLRKKVQDSGLYGGQVGPFWCGHDGVWHDVWLTKDTPIAAKVGIIRLDWKEPLWAVAKYDSYVQRGADQNPTRFWQQMPDNMLALAAERLAIRKAFPHETKGLAVEGEQRMIDEPQTTVVVLPPERTLETFMEPQRQLSAKRPEPVEDTDDTIDDVPPEEPAEYPEPQPEPSDSKWPPYKPFAEVPKVGAVVASRTQLVQWITKREQDCEANALSYPALDADADDLALANHWAQLKAILEAPKGAING
jgi:phage recombination protein Bet